MRSLEIVNRRSDRLRSLPGRSREIDGPSTCVIVGITSAVCQPILRRRRYGKRAMIVLSAVTIASSYVSSLAAASHHGS